MLYDICWKRDVYLLNIYIIRVYYCFNRYNVLYKALKQV